MIECSTVHSVGDEKVKREAEDDEATGEDQSTAADENRK